MTTNYPILERVLRGGNVEAIRSVFDIGVDVKPEQVIAAAEAQFLKLLSEGAEGGQESEKKPLRTDLRYHPVEQSSQATFWESIGKSGLS